MNSIQPNPEAILLRAVESGMHDNRSVPEIATSTIDLTILQLAIDGEIPPEKLAEIYAPMDKLRKMLIATLEDRFKTSVNRPEDELFARALNDLLMYLPD